MLRDVPSNASKRSAPDRSADLDISSKRSVAQRAMPDDVEVGVQGAYQQSGLNVGGLLVKGMKTVDTDRCGTLCYPTTD